MHYLDNLLLNTDSYKASHWLQYPPGTDARFSTWNRAVACTTRPRSSACSRS